MSKLSKFKHEIGDSVTQRCETFLKRFNSNEVPLICGIVVHNKRLPNGKVLTTYAIPTFSKDDLHNQKYENPSGHAFDKQPEEKLESLPRNLPSTGLILDK